FVCCLGCGGGVHAQKSTQSASATHQRPRCSRGTIKTMPAIPPAASAPTSEQLPESPKAPPPGRKFPCAKCGARLDFDPSSHGLKCPYCGYLEKIEPTAKEVQERDWNVFWSHYEEDDTPLAGR